MSSEAAISLDELIAKPLPIFGHSALAFRKLRSEQDSGSAFERYGDIILKDPGLALHTLQELHAASSKPSRAETSSMSQAAMLLGIERVQQLTTGQPELEGTLKGLAKAGYARTVCRAFHSAFQAWDWAHVINDHAPEEILLATLLHDVAEMALWVSAPEKVHLMRKLIFKDHLHTDEAQYIAFGESLDHFSRQIATHWHLPHLVHEALRPENIDNSRAQCVMLAIQLGRAAERGWHTEKTHNTIKLIADYLDKSPEETTTHVHKNAVRAALEAPFFNSRPAAALLPLIPGDDHILIEEEFPEDEAEIEAEIMQMPGLNTQQQDQNTSTQNDTSLLVNAIPAAQICLTPQPGIYEKTTRELNAGIGEMGINDVMRSVIHGLHDGLGLNRVVFSLLTKDRQKLVSRYIIGADNDPVFSRFHIRLDKPNLFGKLLEKPVSLWINAGNRKKYWSVIPDEFKTLIKTNTFYTMSVHVKEKPIGLFYADRRSTECELDDRSYQQFRKICLLASKCLAHASNNK